MARKFTLVRIDLDEATYILNTENGVSLRAAGWKMIGETPGRSWSVPSRPRIDTHPLQGRFLFEASA